MEVGSGTALSDPAGRNTHAPPVLPLRGAWGEGRREGRSVTERRGTRMGRAWHAVLPVVVALGACAHEQEPPRARELPGTMQSVETLGAVEAEKVVEAVKSAGVPGESEAMVELLLIGDAGKPAPGGDPVLIAAERMAAQAPQRTTVVFLGDNLYPEGMPDEAGPRRTEAERILQAQLDVPVRSGARGIFVAGNHDWDHSGPEGWAETQLQAEYIARHGQGRVRLLPGNGCPGPEVVDLPGGLRLLALDSQWWLHPFDKPRPPRDLCPAPTDSAVIARLQDALREAAGRPVVVVAHHPLVSGGTHGVFPLLPTRFAPVPKFSAQDLGHRKYRHMIRVLQAGFAANPPLVHAAGHDHNLQLLRGVGSRFQIVSGTGIFDHTGPVRRLRGTVYAKRASGFVRLSLLTDGTVRMDAFTVNAAGESHRDFSRILSPDA